MKTNTLNKFNKGHDGCYFCTEPCVTSRIMNCTGFHTKDWAGLSEPLGARVIEKHNKRCV